MVFLQNLCLCYFFFQRSKKFCQYAISIFEWIYFLENVISFLKLTNFKIKKRILIFKFFLKKRKEPFLSFIILDLQSARSLFLQICIGILLKFYLLFFLQLCILCV